MEVEGTQGGGDVERGRPQQSVKISRKEEFHQAHADGDWGDAAVGSASKGDCPYQAFKFFMIQAKFIPSLTLSPAIKSHSAYDSVGCD